MIKRKLEEANVAFLEQMFEDFVELDGRIFVCDMTIEMMGINKKDLREGVLSKYCAIGDLHKGSGSHPLHIAKDIDGLCQLLKGIQKVGGVPALPWKISY